MNRELWAIFILGHASVMAEEVVQDFESLQLGKPPKEFLVLEGKFAVVAHGGGKTLKLEPEPLAECGLLLGKSSKGPMTVEARVLANKRGRRSFPRFGVGTHGISGYRIRVVPAWKRIELIHGDEVVEKAPFQWKSGTWCFMKLALSNAGGRPKVRAWVWMDGEESPAEPTLTFDGEEGELGQGKATIWGTPYSGKEILYDDIKVTRAPAD